MKLSAYVARWILSLFGWTYVNRVNPLPPKAVIIVAPHTSNWDFIIGKLCFMALGERPNFLIKKEWFFFPIGFFLKKCGGYPVDRENPGDLVDQLVKEFNSRPSFLLVITPEGTRKAVRHWKKGFYRISMAAHVPILISYLDYRTKTACIEDKFFPSGDYDTDIQKLRTYYQHITPRYPEKFVLPEP